LAIGLLLLGGAAFESFFAAFQQIFVGAIFPLSEAQHHLSAFAAESARSGSLAAIGVVATKLAAFQLLPLHSQPGLRLVATVIPAVERRAAKSPLPFFLPLLAIILSWLIACGAYLMG
jgi:hypothetical protein